MTEPIKTGVIQRFDVRQRQVLIQRLNFGANRRYELNRIVRRADDKIPLAGAASKGFRRRLPMRAVNHRADAPTRGAIRIVFRIAHDADDREPGGLAIRCADPDPFAERVLIGEETPREVFVDNGGAFRAFSIPLIKSPAFDQRDAHCHKIIRTDDIKILGNVNFGGITPITV